MNYKCRLQAKSAIGVMGAFGAVDCRFMLGLKIAKTPDFYKLWEYEARETWIS